MSFVSCLPDLEYRVLSLVVDDIDVDVDVDVDHARSMGARDSKLILGFLVYPILSIES